MLGDGASLEDSAQLRRTLGLDRPLLVQYARFMTGVVEADLGQSLRTSEPVTRAIAVRIPATLELAAAAVALAVLLAVPLGIVAAVRAGTPLDHAATIAALVGISMPSFW